MGKRCECAAILEAARGDHRLRLVAPGARWLWLMLLDTMVRAAEPGVFMIGAAAGKVGDMSLMFSVEKVDAESWVESLEKVGLLARRGDGALVAGEGVMRAIRPVNPSRAPVLGRPRKGETHEDYRRRQRELRLMGVMEGGRAESPEKSGESPAAMLSLAEEEAAESKQAARTVTPELVREVGEAAAEAAGLDPAKGRWTYGIVGEWLAAGADRGVILGAIRGVMARPRPPVVQQLKYFDGVVKAALRARPAEVAAGEGDWAPGEAAAFAAAWERWDRGGRVGPMPMRGRAA